MGIINFIIVLSILVFVHELGHFLVARYVGVKVNVFSIGFGKRLISKQYKGTLWQFALIPLGGYIQMKGQDDSNPSKIEIGNDSYSNKSPIQRMAILFAGPLANFILAFFLYLCIALMGSNALSPTIGEVLKDSPAYKIGLQSGDTIIRINNTDIKTWRTLTKVIKDSKGALKFYIKKNNQIFSKIIHPQIGPSQNIFNEKITKRMIGIKPSYEVIVVNHSFIEGLIFAYDRTVESSKIIFIGVQKLLVGVIPTSEIGGIVSIGEVVSKASQSSIITLFSIMALLSVNLGVLNLLPIPALDGGHIMFNLYEFITRKKPSQQIFTYLTISGWLILASLMFLGLYNDVVRMLN